LLSRVDRIGLVLRIGEEYARTLSYSRMLFVLESLGFDTSPAGIDAKVDTGTDEQLCELALTLGVELPPGAIVDSNTTTATVTVTAAEPLFIFASHLTLHKVLVGDVSRALATYGINLFVAHDTITHDTAWEDEIKSALDRADAGLVFVHEGLKESPWCDQEIGWLQGRGVPVMALKFDIAPYGFFAKYQAQQVPINATPQQIAEMTMTRIAAKPELAVGFAASLVSAMASKDDFDATRARWLYLRDLDCLDTKLCAQLLAATKSNNQIYWANSVLDDDNRQLMSRLIIAFLRRQPGGSTIAPDIDAYEQYLDDRDASGVGIYTTHDPPPATVTE